MTSMSFRDKSEAIGYRSLAHGDEIEVDSDSAERMVKAKLAEPVKGDRKQTPDGAETASRQPKKETAAGRAKRQG